MWTRDKTIVTVTVIVLAVRMQLVHLVTLLLIVTMARARYSHQQARQAAVESVPKLVAIIYTGYLHRLSTKYLHNIYTISTRAGLRALPRP